MLGIPTIVILIYILVDTDHLDYCEYNYVVANVIEFVNYVLTIAFVIYSVKRIGEGYYKAYERHENPNSIGKEVLKFLCYDIIVLLFVFFFIWTFIWDIIVLAWANNENDY